jgi:hypothetical protein
VVDAGADDKYEWTRQAIDVMTAWAAPGETAGFAASRVAAYTGAERQGAMKLTVGFINLIAILLLQIEDLSGSDIHSILRDAARITL